MQANNESEQSVLDSETLTIELLNHEVNDLAIKEGLIEDPNKKEVIVELNEVEKEQSEKGWKPKADFIANGGHEDDWIPAKQFKRVGEIISAKQQASKQAQVANAELKELSQAVKILAEDNRKAKIRMQEERLEELRQLKLQKIQEGDAPAVYKAEADAAKLIKETEQLNPQPQPAIEDVRVKEWEAKNKWLREDSNDPDEQIKLDAMRALVGRRAQYYMDNDPNVDPMVALADIDSQLIKLQKQFSPKEAPVSKVSVSDTGGIKGKPNLLGKLNFEQRKIFASMSKIPNSYTIEEYVELLQKAGEL